MELKNSFTVAVPVDRAWEVLTDVPTIAPCLPGAQLKDTVEGDDGPEYHGIVKVKVGPIVAQYKGKATFVEQDADGHRVVLRAEGRETRGQGNASALITATLVGAGDSTEVDVHTELTVTGKVAQFGRGVMADVSGKLMDQFADNLAEKVLASEPGEADGAPDAGGDAAESTEASPPSSQGAAANDAPAPEPEPIDLLQTAGAPAVQRLVPPILAAIVALVIIRLVLRRRRD